jgi:hypothetical protein
LLDTDVVALFTWHSVISGSSERGIHTSSSRLHQDMRRPLAGAAIRRGATI